MKTQGALEPECSGHGGSSALSAFGYINTHSTPPYPAAQRAMAVSDPSFSPKGVLPSP
jgi:hypothetical protein